MAGIQQTEDVVRAVAAVGLFLYQARADGYNLDDIRTAMGDEKLRTKVVEAVKGSQEVPGEISDGQLREYLQLALAALSEVRGV
jgi:hypothetical protein